MLTAWFCLCSTLWLRRYFFLQYSWELCLEHLHDHEEMWRSQLRYKQSHSCIHHLWDSCGAWYLDVALVMGLRKSPSTSSWWLMDTLWDHLSNKSSHCLRSDPKAVPALFWCLCPHSWDTGALALIPRFLQAYLLTFPSSSPAPRAPHASLQTTYFSWVSGSP